MTVQLITTLDELRALRTGWNEISGEVCMDAMVSGYERLMEAIGARKSRSRR